MKFKRWGTLAPQRHDLKHDSIRSFHEAPVEKGIYAFPAHYACRDIVNSFCCLSNGRIEYVKDKNGKRIMMTQEEFDDIVVDGDWYDWKTVVIYPLFLKGMRICSLWLKKTKTDAPYVYVICDEDEEEGKDDKDDLLMNEEDKEDEKGKKYPLMKRNDRLRIFNYDGNIWHHLETTEPYEHWYSYIWNTEYEPDPGKKIKRLVKPEDIIRKSGSWILTSMRTYEKALKKASNIAKFNAMLQYKDDKYEDFHSGFHSGMPSYYVDLENFEVFIEKVK